MVNLPKVTNQHETVIALETNRSGVNAITYSIKEVGVNS
jgi:hypothetical protein